MGSAPTNPPASSSSGSTLNGLTAPSIVSPLPGNSFSDPSPTLTVRNAASQSSATVTYDFEVATDDAFRTMAAATAGHPQGGSGETSWRVATSLTNGRYYWRARGVGSLGPGPYSPISDFFIGGSSTTTTAPPSPSPSPGSTEIYDPLTNGMSVGDQRGGRFVSAGWMVTSRGDFIRYVVPTMTSGFVEWENLGMARRNPAHDLYTLFGMWDPSKGPYRENPYRVHIRKLDDQGHNPPYVRLRWISGGEEHNDGFHFFDWHPSRAYRWRIEWGGHQARVYLDGQQIITTNYGPTYQPEDHWIEMGVEERAESIPGVVYRNVRIGRR